MTNGGCTVGGREVRGSRTKIMVEERWSMAGGIEKLRRGENRWLVRWENDRGERKESRWEGKMVEEEARLAGEKEERLRSGDRWNGK